MFEFNHIFPFDRANAERPGPMVLFATPGMLHAGTSLEVFKLWAHSELNMVIIPGYCVHGTIGHKLLNGQLNQLEVDRKTIIDVKCKIRYLSFSAHADAKGIMQLIRQVEPRNVVLVHGEGSKMGFLKQRIIREFGIDCFDPPTGVSIMVKSSHQIPVDLSSAIVKRKLVDSTANEEMVSTSLSKGGIQVEGVMLLRDGKVKFLDEEEASAEVGVHAKRIIFEHTISTPADCDLKEVIASTKSYIREHFENLSDTLNMDNHSISVKTVQVAPSETDKIVVVWENKDDAIAMQIITYIHKAVNE